MATADHEQATTDHSSGRGPVLVWDCSRSVLYDCYELTAFTRQLDAAVLTTRSRSLSMPHLTDSVASTTSPPTTTADVQQQQQARPRRRRRRRLPALLRRLFSKVLRLRLFPTTGALGGARYRTGDDGTGLPWSGALTSIPEEQGSSSPETAESQVEPAAQSKLRKTQSERFIGSQTATSMVQFEVVL